MQLSTGAGAATPGGFTIRQDTDVLPRQGDFEAREDTEVLRMGATGGFDVREDTEILRIGGNGVQGGAGVGGHSTEGCEVRLLLCTALTCPSCSFKLARAP